ncbi:response regulator transcription factor [Curtobacterium sp. VKM Ac-1395]|jgi:two-component system response regulator QseB|uniref:response regulator transcription factor n=1 Tax=Curtobacterium sp. VKM Ac-1395 TaxID=2783815 RepID=UPI00188A6F0D|nr:response regulator transcription factor [Curtobacterium sp. VKM Ac-1395]MBF4591741.1 response regulator transcription factor [Curtobacterium sp. VKM Ac-1395]
MMLRLLLIEDDPRLGPLVADVLGQEWDVTLCEDGESALQVAAEQYFDVMVVDRRLPGIDGTEVIATLRKRRISTPVLMLTALGEVRDRVSGLDAGANDYLVKPFDFDELTARLRALTRDYSGVGAGIEIGGWVFYPEDSSITSPYTGRVMLTEKEAAMLRLLASEPSRAFTRQHLLSAVFEHGEQLGTVDTYVHYIRRKTDRDLISTIRGVGYRLGTPA